ncbi:hypothetical protein YA0089_27960 [Pseudomonas viridiflava]|uniref:hypothetical protein n=1 Tax=Pseudomonas viridiflava TaxID=33069 RepID=UPI0018E62285|nr:hypothetical protein [Pseudomonas viridiflava]MBI6727457.1 hypothetical protein [Pseudomonas viridiflava]
MIFAAALSDGPLSHDDFLFVLSHNAGFKGMMLKGKVELAEATQPAGHMRRFVWKLNDHEIESTDVTFVVIFSKVKNPRSIVDHQFMLARRSAEIQNCLDWLADELNPEDVETVFVENGNLAYILCGCDTSGLSGAFAGHARKAIREV